MKNLNVYTLYDKEAKTYDTPFFTRGDVFAQRHFIMMQKKGGSMVSDFPEQFQLMFIGTFNVDSGKIEPVVIKKIMDGEPKNEENKE